MLVLDDVARGFGAHRAVDGVSFEVERGGITGLIGPNGAGKTTLFNLVAGSLPLERGRVILDGLDISREPATARPRRGIARTFQIPRPFRAMTVLENLLVAAQGQRGEKLLPNFLAGATIARQERRARERARALLDFLDLAPLADAPAGILSGGQRKLLELARALMAEPRLILLDEPAAGVAPPLLETILARVLDLRARGMTFLVIEHDIALVRRLCDVVHVMVTGRLLLSGTPEQVIRDPTVQDAYLGQPA